MTGYETGNMCRSLAGHDKGQLFVIIGETGEYVSIVNGGSRPLEKPKRKKKKHIQVIHIQKERSSQAKAGRTVEKRFKNEEVRQMIWNYERRSQL